MRRRPVVVVEAIVTTLLADQVDISVDIRMESHVVARQGVRACIMIALKPWLGERLLKKGVLIYMHHGGRVEVATKATTLDDLMDAEAVEIVVQADEALPSAAANRSQAPRKRAPGGSSSESENEPIFGSLDL